MQPNEGSCSGADEAEDDEANGEDDETVAGVAVSDARAAPH